MRPSSMAESIALRTAQAMKSTEIRWCLGCKIVQVVLDLIDPDERNPEEVYSCD